MKKLLLGLLLSVSVGVGVVMANEAPKDDLLAMATMGKTSGVEVEMNKSEMKDADGGYYFRRYTASSVYNTYYRQRSFRTSYSNPNANSYRGTSRSYIYANAFNGFN